MKISTPLQTRLKIMTFVKVIPVLSVAVALVACGGQKGEAPSAGGSKKSEAPATSSRRAAVSKATDDIPSSNRTDLYVDRYRFGDTTDADGIVVKETSVIAPGSTAAMSFFVRNVPASTQVRVVWNDVGKNATVGEEVKPVGDKGFVTFKQASPSPEGNYRVNMYYRVSQSSGWSNLGTHDFRVGGKS
jgi:hypothetical protein